MLFIFSSRVYNMTSVLCAVRPQWKSKVTCLKCHVRRAEMFFVKLRVCTRRICHPVTRLGELLNARTQLMFRFLRVVRFREFSEFAKQASAR